MTNLLIVLAALIACALAYFIFRGRSRRRMELEQCRLDAQARRMQMADKRMADNGGRALSSKFAATPETSSNR